jgi:hypothetical protein
VDKDGSVDLYQTAEYMEATEASSSVVNMDTDRQVHRDNSTV